MFEEETAGILNRNFELSSGKKAMSFSNLDM
jgi:hypothetical protein